MLAAALAALTVLTLFVAVSLATDTGAAAIGWRRTFGIIFAMIAAVAAAIVALALS